MAEILIRRMGNANLSQVFPGYAGYAPLGIVQGSDLAVSAMAPPPLATALPVAAEDTLRGNTIARDVPDWQRRGRVERFIPRREH
jgi:hypothetical protein